MLLAFIILFFTSVICLQTYIPYNESGIYENVDLLDIYKLQSEREHKFHLKFGDQHPLACANMHATKITPFAAIILYKTSGRLLCMGSIIDRFHILTAKRCYRKSDVCDILVLVGYYKPYWGRYSQVKRVKRVIRHEYLVAILRLEEPITYTPYVQAVRLPTSITKTEPNISTVFPPPYRVVGFEIDRFSVPGDYVDLDKTYEIKQDTIVDTDACNTNYSSITFEREKLFCVIGNATYCWGGLGGPVLKMVPEKYFLQVGVVVSDNCTADTTGPLLAARTDSFGDWIRGNSYHGFQST